MTDSEFGEISIRVNARAKRFTFRSQEGGLLVTVYPHFREEQLRESIEQMRPKLRLLVRRSEQRRAKREPVRIIDWNFRIVTDLLSFQIRLSESQPSDRVQFHKEHGSVTLYCSPDFDFHAEGRQEWLQKVIVEQVRNYAKGILPARLRVLSQQFNLPFEKVAINAAKGRWGSCKRTVTRRLGIVSSTSYDIHLSLYTLLLPERLQRLVMLHELTHTLEMNHSAQFHAKLDRMLGGEEAALERDLKLYTTSIFSFARPVDNSSNSVD